MNPWFDVGRLGKAFPRLESVMNTCFERHGVELIPVPADGDCMYHVTRLYMEESKKMPVAELRRLVREYLRTEAEFKFMGKTLSAEDVEERSGPKAWGDMVTLCVFAVMFGWNVWVLDAQGDENCEPICVSDYVHGRENKLYLHTMDLHYDGDRLSTLEGGRANMPDPTVRPLFTFPKARRTPSV